LRSNYDNQRSVDPDIDLVKRIAMGDGHAASALVRRHLNAMVGLARGMLGDEMEAEDVAQEVFLKVWVHAKKWKPGKAKFLTWMHRVAINLCYDRLRKKREVYMDVLPEQIDLDAVSADEEIMNRQRASSIELALKSLAPRQRAAIILCHLHEMGNLEAAAVLEVSVEALESLLGRGRRGLRAALMNQRDELLNK